MMPYPKVDEVFYKHRSIFLGHLYCNHEDQFQYADHFPDLDFVKWHDYAYDFLPKGASKAVGIRKLLEFLDINHENCFAFGDGLNDLEMLSMIGTGIVWVMGFLKQKPQLI